MPVLMDPQSEAYQKQNDANWSIDHDYVSLYDQVLLVPSYNTRIYNIVGGEYDAVARTTEEEEASPEQIISSSSSSTGLLSISFPSIAKDEAQSSKGDDIAADVAKSTILSDREPELREAELTFSTTADEYSTIGCFKRNPVGKTEVTFSSSETTKTKRERTKVSKHTSGKHRRNVGDNSCIKPSKRTKKLSPPLTATRRKVTVCNVNQNIHNGCGIPIVDELLQLDQNRQNVPNQTLALAFQSEQQQQHRTESMAKMMMLKSTNNNRVHQDHHLKVESNNPPYSRNASTTTVPFSAAIPSRLFPQFSNAETAVASSTPNRPPRTATLYLPLDADYLSEFHCLFRQQIEFFEFTDDYLKLRHRKTTGGSQVIRVGQVGVRCKHCAVALPPERRDKHSFVFTNSLDFLYQTVQKLYKHHLLYDHYHPTAWKDGGGHCRYVPLALKNNLLNLKSTGERASGGKRYWTASAQVLGIHETPTGLRFEEPRAKTTRTKK